MFDHLSSMIEENLNITDEMRARLRYRLGQNVQLIIDWKKHLLRTVHQDGARKHVLDELDETSVFLVADWAMKWLPTRYREAQRDFFGKRGLPWHITYAIRLKPGSSSSCTSLSSASCSSSNNRSFEHRTFCHVFDNAKQDGRTVISILSNVIMIFDALQTLHNAKCSNVYIILALSHISCSFRAANRNMMKCMMPLKLYLT